MRAGEFDRHLVKLADPVLFSNLIADVSASRGRAEIDISR